MICNSCHATIPEGMAFCPNCGEKVTIPTPAEQTFPPVQSMPTVPPVRYYPPVEPTPRPAQPLVGMICGIISLILSIVLYFLLIVRAASGAGTSGIILFCVFGVGLAIFALVFSIIGMRRSIRTGGRKYVPGIVFSAVGIATSASALMFLFLGFIIGSVAVTAVRTTPRYYY